MIPRASIICLLLLATNIFNANACGPMYPYGEEVRFCLLRPEYFSFTGKFSPFIYTSELFYRYNGFDFDTVGREPNALLWKKRCKSEIPISEITDGVYNYSDAARGSNLFLKHLVKNNDIEALNYIAFAKSCENFNSFIIDPWERNDSYVLPQRRKLIEAALKAAETVKDGDIKKRYAFLAIRLAYYNEQYIDLSSTYKKYFFNKENDIVDYWAMYFYAFTQKNKAYSNYLLSKVFRFAPDKRFMASSLYDRKLLSATLPFAKNNQEKATILMLNAIRNPGKALAEIKQIQNLYPGWEGVDFLVLREINKIEDWVLTPYYTNFGIHLLIVGIAMSCLLTSFYKKGYLQTESMLVNC